MEYARAWDANRAVLPVIHHASTQGGHR
jgi:hypothetical protein